MVRLLLILSLLLSGCNLTPEKDDASDKCELNNQKSAESYYRYYFDGDQSHLDSALFYIDEVLGSCEEYLGLLSLRKLSILSEKQEYSQALNFIETFDEDLFSDLPYFQDLLKYRFSAMREHSKGNLELRNRYLESGIENISEFLSANKTKADSLVRLPEVGNILSDPLGTAITQYYFYKSVVEGPESIGAEITNLQEEQRWNEEFIDFLRTCLQEDFLIFNGM